MPVHKVTQYETHDGERFTTYAEAQNHERNIQPQELRELIARRFPDTLTESGLDAVEHVLRTHAREFVSVLRKIVDRQKKASPT